MTQVCGSGFLSLLGMKQCNQVLPFDKFQPSGIRRYPSVQADEGTKDEVDGLGIPTVKLHTRWWHQWEEDEPAIIRRARTYYS